MNYMEGTAQIKTLIQEKSEQVIPSLQHIVKQLIEMVENDVLFSFEFNSNMSNGKKENIAIFLSPSKTHRKIQLGQNARSHNIDLFQQSLDQATLEKITNMHEYLMFLNEYMVFAIPEIRRSTRFRKETNRESDQPRIPKFAENVMASAIDD